MTPYVRPEPRILRWLRLRRPALRWVAGQWVRR